jgi:hypothetical protein
MPKDTRTREKTCAECGHPWEPDDLDGVGYPVPTGSGVRLEQVHGRCEQAFSRRITRGGSEPPDALGLY